MSVTDWEYSDDRRQAWLMTDDRDALAVFAAVDGGGWELVGSDLIHNWPERAAILGVVPSLERVRPVERCELCLGEVVFNPNGYHHVQTGGPASALHVTDDIEVYD